MRVQNHASQSAILKTELQGLELNHPGRDVALNAGHKDYRFLAVRGDLNSFEGLDVDPNVLIETYGMRIIEGADGDRKNAEYRHLVETVVEYANAYNTALKQWLQKEGLWFKRIDKAQALWSPPHEPFESESYDPPHGYVPDADTAIRIAKAVWQPIYGKREGTVYPVVAQERNGIWYVRGTLPKYSVGGVPYAVIRACNGEILGVTATQ